MKRAPAILVLALILSMACRSADAPTAPAIDPATPKNVILFIGDGIGSTHFTVLHQIRGEESTLPRFTNSALMTTHSSDSLVTDSGAGASAIATGVKAPNAGISVNAKGEPVETVLEIAERRGMATGLITTTGFWDATPAAFAAHTTDRREAEKIVQQMLASGVDLVISNKVEKFGTEGRPTLEQLASSTGYTAVTNPDELDASAEKILAVFPEVDHDLDYPGAPIPELTRFAIEKLSRNDEGFFLMVESEGTDTASHQNVTSEVFDSLRYLDQAVEIALDFAEEHGDTLVLFTGDHETGAFQISPESEDGQMKLDWFSGKHTGQALPLFAYGPGSARFTGWIDNTDVGKWLKEMVGR